MGLLRKPEPVPAEKQPDNGKMPKNRSKVPSSRICISIPRDLHDELREHGDFNWSSVCTEALRRRLEEGPDGA